MKSRIVILAALFVGACSDTPTTPRAVTKAPSIPAPSAPSLDVIAGSQLVTNGSFENPVIPGFPNPWVSFNSVGQGLPGWTVASGSVDIQSGEPGAPFTNVPNGSQVLDLNNATISQSVATTAGVTYRVAFKLSENYAILNGAPVNVTVSFGGTTQSFSFSGGAGESAANMRWDAHSFDVTASAASTTLQITAGAGSNGAGGPMLDDIQVQSPSTYTSGSNVTAYDPLPGGTDQNWETDVCTTQPAISIDDPRWTNPHPAYTMWHSWIDSYFSGVNWINAWSTKSESSLPSLYPNAGFVQVPGTPDYYNWTKYTTTVSGQGSYVIQLLADNCSWIYLDGQLVGVQGTDLSKNTYAVTLHGTETLSFLIFDGGGDAGGKFLLQTYQSYLDNNHGQTVIQPPPTPNTAPTIAAQNAAVAVNEGATATNTGTVADADNDAVTLTASAGTVTNNGNGTWSWSYATTDGPTQSQTVTVTADDGHNHTVSTQFALAVANVAPTNTATSAPGTINMGQSYTLTGSFTDPGASDGPWSVSINWGDGSSTQTVSTSTTSFSAAHTYANFGKYAITYTVTDKDGGASAAASTSVSAKDPTPPIIVASVNAAAPSTTWYAGNPVITWSVKDPESGVDATTEVGCSATSITQDSPLSGTTYTCSAKNNSGVQGTGSVTVKRDGTKPVITYTGNTGTYTVDQTVAITCSATDALSGIATNTCANVSGNAYDFALGVNTYSASATDVAGNASSATTSFTVVVTQGSLCALVDRFVANHGIQNSLCVKLAHGSYGAFVNEVAAQSGKAMTTANAALLTQLANALAQQ
ncbi:MAG TPA: DUF642 domain-containing protein [Gemmatimonadaceae bacterium]|nr:DUF642 domain-containing protein [Gemmatimonadaceae bacterium]